MIKHKYPIIIIVLLICSSILVKFMPVMFYINITASEPLGIYKVVPITELKRGDFVVVSVPEEFDSYIYGRGWTQPKVPLIKNVGAVENDHYTVTNEEFLINNIKIGPIAKVDGFNNPMPKLKAGEYKVRPGAILIVSSHDIRSFDSRYMGEIPITNIKAKVIPWITW